MTSQPWKKNNCNTNIAQYLKKQTQPWKQTIAIHILPNISRSKDNQTTKFGQSIEYKVINIFL